MTQHAFAGGAFEVKTARGFETYPAEHPLGTSTSSGATAAASQSSDPAFSAFPEGRIQWQPSSGENSFFVGYEDRVAPSHSVIARELGGAVIATYDGSLWVSASIDCWAMTEAGSPLHRRSGSMVRSCTGLRRCGGAWTALPPPMKAGCGR